MQTRFEELPPHACFVTAANSYGIMSAGIDAAVVRFHGEALMRRMRAQANFLEKTDVHIHFPRDWENPDADPEPMVDRLAEVAARAGVTKGCVLTGGRFGPGYDRGIEILQKYPEIFIPVALIDPEVTDGDHVAELHAMGYRGLKLIGVARDYDTPDYFSAYAKAEELDRHAREQRHRVDGALACDGQSRHHVVADRSTQQLDHRHEPEVDLAGVQEVRAHRRHIEAQRDTRITVEAIRERARVQEADGADTRHAPPRGRNAPSRSGPGGR